MFLVCHAPRIFLGSYRVEPLHSIIIRQSRDFKFIQPQLSWLDSQSSASFNDNIFISITSRVSVRERTYAGQKGWCPFTQGNPSSSSFLLLLLPLLLLHLILLLPLLFLLLVLFPLLLLRFPFLLLLLFLLLPPILLLLPFLLLLLIVSLSCIFFLSSPS